MMNTISIRSVTLGKTVNWLVFKAFARKYSIIRRYTIEFCGTELQTSIPLVNHELEELKSLLLSDFGYAPYDDCLAREIIGDGKDYILTK